MSEEKKGQIVTFSRFMDMPLPTADADPVSPEEAAEMAEKFRAAYPGVVGFCNKLLQQELLDYASKPLPECWDIKSAPLSRWECFKYRLNKWLPRIHFGECNHDDCY